MIISTITSGLGNQLFQYAFARQKTIKNNTSLYLDLRFYKSEYSKETNRSFKLNKFHIPYKEINEPIKYLIKLSKLFPNHSIKPVYRTVQERFYHYDSESSNAKSLYTNLKGYWHSEKYFVDIQDIIRKELRFANTPCESYHKYEKLIYSVSNSVSLHIRRGDYVHHPEFSKTFGFIGLQYYEKAIQYILSKYPDSTFFVFTDDPDWVNQNLTNHMDFTLIENTGIDADLDDLHLMSLCKHNIIANSSFSWWGGWLNNNPNKTVIAPSNWFKNQPLWDTKDLLPKTWIQLKSFES